MLDVPFPFGTHILTGTYFLTSLWYESVAESAASGPHSSVCVWDACVCQFCSVHVLLAVLLCMLPEERLMDHGSMVKSRESTALECKLPSADPC